MKKQLLILLVASAGAIHLSAAEWESFQFAELRDDEYFDGDSFHIYTKREGASRGHTYHFRLYGVDCPETDRSVAERNAQQAKRMGVDVKEIVEWGKKAKKFTRKFLDDEFVVWTKKEGALGRDKDRYYALISKEVDGRIVWLHEELLLNGLARAYGRGVKFRNSDAKAYWDSSREFSNDCRSKQNRARQAKVGIWQDRDEDEFDAFFGSD